MSRRLCLTVRPLRSAAALLWAFLILAPAALTAQATGVRRSPAARSIPTASRAARVARAAPFRQLEFALLEDYDKGADLDTVRADFHVMKDLGIRTWRGSFGWDDYEPRPGVYDFAWLRKFVALAEREQIRLRPYIGYTPAWAAGGGHDRDVWNDPPRSIARWRAFVRRIAGEFAHSAVASWEIYNEENAPQWFDGTADRYADVLASASAAIRAVAPRVQVLLGGLTYPDAGWIRTLCERRHLGRAFDVAPLHVYAETWPREKRVEDVLAGDDYRRQFLLTLRKDCGRQPVWVNETGYATNPGRTESEQAAWWARAIATFAADTTVHFVGVYETRDLAKGAAVIGEPENYYLGIRRSDGTHKLAYSTVKLMVRLFGVPFRVLDPADSAGEAVMHRFERQDGRRVLVAWTRGAAPATVRLDLGRPAHNVTLYSVTGVVLRTFAASGSEDLTLVPGDVTILAD